MTVQIPDAITVIAQLSDGGVATCIQSGVAHFGQDRIEIFGAEGTLAIVGGKLLGAKAGAEGLAPLHIPSEFETGPTPEEDFVRMLRGEIEQASVSFRDGARNLEFLEAAHRSATVGAWVDLPLDQSPMD